jgi:excisionase family DNA binding protein
VTTPYVTTLQAAEMLGVTDRRVRQMVEEGVLEGLKLGRDVLVEREAVQALDLERHYPAHRLPRCCGLRFNHIVPPKTTAELRERAIGFVEQRRSGGGIRHNDAPSTPRR